ncbi:MAG TPA: SIMPL domain-containing protein [Verrucomicrobiae bacterium]|nr:SIMPL domain-containing protein [Verrucomicrobiae bacterium]
MALAKDNPAVARSLVAVAILLVIFLAAQTWKTLLESHQIGFAPRVPDTFTVSGEGKVSGQPTLAEVSLGLYSEGQDVPTVQNANSSKVNGIIDAMKQMGISQDDMQTSNYSIQPKYDYSNGTQTVVGYTVSQSLNVKVRDLTKVGAVVSKAGQLGANQVNGVTFTIDDPSELQQQARAKAIEDARKKADELAKTLGVTIVRVSTFSESSPATPGPIFYSDLAAAPQAKAVSPDIQPGSLDVKSDVSVTFEIR